jgi:hypothetical protein
MKTVQLSYYDVTLEDEGSTIRPVGLFYNLPDAQKACDYCIKNKKWYGSPTPVNKELIIYDSFEEYMANSKVRARQSAIEKLTDEEREALGL